MTLLADLSFKVHAVLLMSPGRQGQSAAGIVSKLMDHRYGGLCSKWQETHRHICVALHGIG